MTKKATTVSSSTSDFVGRVLLVHTTDPKIIRAIEDVREVQIASETFLEGKLISPEANHFDNGKVVRINIRFIISITDFDSADQIMARKRGDLKLFTSTPNEEH